jgi:riboflavin kinase/FMN adenylyltransferase
MCLPADGVYAGMFTCADGSVHGCAINLGRRPTFFEHADVSLLEAHLLDFSADLYGQQVSVTFEHFLRSERKFDGLDAIKAQLQLDVSAARGLVGRK